MQRRQFLTILPLAFAAMAHPVQAAGKPPVFTGLIDGVGAGGYDVVAYFTASQAVPGKPDLTAVHDGVTYRFSNSANRDLFAANPAGYLPQYGGYCAYAVSKGHTAGVSPKAWKIVDGKLYLNHRFATGKFDRDVSGAIAAADKNWPTIPKRAKE